MSAAMIKVAVGAAGDDVNAGEGADGGDKGNVGRTISVGTPAAAKANGVRSQ
jgi:hypothetical protein